MGIAGKTLNIGNHSQAGGNIGQIHVGDKTLEILGPILKLSLKIGSKRIHAHMSYDGVVANYSKLIMIVLISGQNTCLTL